MKCKNCGKNHDLTICFVYHSPEAKTLLDANRRFIEEMDPAMNIQWLIADNTPEGRKATQHRQEGSVIIVPGAEMPMDKPAYARRSYHHARGLNKLLPYIQTRYALVPLAFSKIQPHAGAMRDYVPADSDCGIAEHHVRPCHHLVRHINGKVVRVRKLL